MNFIQTDPPGVCEWVGGMMCVYIPRLRIQPKNLNLLKPRMFKYLSHGVFGKGIVVIEVLRQRFCACKWVSTIKCKTYQLAVGTKF